MVMIIRIINVGAAVDADLGGRKDTEKSTTGMVEPDKVASECWRIIQGGVVGAWTERHYS